jgi:hypothetical protein
MVSGGPLPHRVPTLTAALVDRMAARSPIVSGTTRQTNRSEGAVRGVSGGDSKDEMSFASQDAALPFPLTETDRYNLGLTDDQFHPHTWEELKQIIGTRVGRCNKYALI